MALHMKDSENHFISPEQLCIGLYVYIDLPWWSHPFALNRFKIKHQTQISEIQNLGLDRIRYNPENSDTSPITPDSNQPPHINPSIELETAQQIATRSLHEHQTGFALLDCEKQYLQASHKLRNIIGLIRSNSPEVTLEAESLVNNIVDQVLLEGDTNLQMVNGDHLADDLSCHMLNVLVLSLVVAKALKLSKKEMQHLGLAALFHDIGKIDVPNAVIMKEGPLNRTEEYILKQHVEYGTKISRSCGFDDRVTKLISQHHENYDGSGYPTGLSYAKIDPLARIISMVNAYDNLCNPSSNQKKMTPYGALSQMFTHDRKKFDPVVLNLFIKKLGIYPPGSIVMLTDNSYGIVISVNSKQLLRPLVKVQNDSLKFVSYDILDLSENKNTEIKDCLLIDQLPSEIAENFQYGNKHNYYFRTSSLSKRVPAQL